MHASEPAQSVEARRRLNARSRPAAGRPGAGNVVSSMQSLGDAPTGTGRHAVELYVRTYTTMLQSSGEIRIDALQQVHIGAGSALHPLAAQPEADMGALLYATRRLPIEIARCRRVILGQSPEDITQVLGESIEGWTSVEAPARRRLWFWDGDNTLAVLTTSNSDIDDLIPCLVAYQIEWNKLHWVASTVGADPEAIRKAACASREDWNRLREAWGPQFDSILSKVVEEECHIRMRMAGSTYVGYARAASRWWHRVMKVMEELGVPDRPIYFVSSNTHSMINMLSGVATRLEAEIVSFIEEEHRHGRCLDIEPPERITHPDASYDKVASYRNWLYFAARRLFDAREAGAAARQRRQEFENEVGIRHLQARYGVDSAAQIFRLDRLAPTLFDPRVGVIDADRLAASRAVLINIDYPLGMAAYHVLRQVGEGVNKVLGVYVMGKAATLNADVGDVMIPNVVHNEHSGNTYWLDNCFRADDIQRHLVYGSALDNQRAVTVRGTFLQNRDYLEFYYRGRYTSVEMEAGPYLDACYEMSKLDRHPNDENVNMSQPGFDLGIIHYASDTPYTQARTLGARGLSYRGMDSTYASAIAIIRRIFAVEGALKA